jgi:photosystem II stability/assembly factor-like uncharacterized protein
MKSRLVSFILIAVSLLSFKAAAQSPWIIQTAAGLSSSQNPQIIFSAVNKDVCWGCSFSSTQFIRTVDGGTHWTVGTIPASSGLIGSRIAAIDSNIAFVILHGASGRGIYKTSDGGSTWTRYADAFNQTDSDPLQIFFFDSTNGVCMGSPSGGNWEIYTTSDTGTNWTRVPSANIPAPLTGETALYRGHANGAGNCFWFTTWSGSLYRTSDKGITWAVTRSVLINDGFSVAFKDSLNGVACTPLSGERISVTSDGGKTWKPVNIKFSSPASYALNYVKGSNNDYIITSDYNRGEPGYSALPGAAYSSDGGMTWKVVDNTSRLWIDFSPDGTGWSGGEKDSIYKFIAFTDKQIIPIQPSLDRIFARKNIDSVLFTISFMNFSNHNFTANLIYTNSENTKKDSLALFDDGLHGDSQANDGIYGAYIPPINADDYFQLNVSTTEDSTNKYVNTPISPRFTTLGPIKIDTLLISKVSSTLYSVRPIFRNEGLSAAVSNLKVKISSSNTNIVTQISPDTISISSIAPGDTAGPTGTVNITLSSRSSGGSFGLNYEIMSGGYTYWKDTVSQILTGIHDIKQKPNSYNLYQNFPNPFNPSTKFSYSIPEKALVTVKVFDILGREVKTLVNEEKPAGTYEVSFNASNLSSGIYFYRLIAGNFISTKKMVLLK